ncbi:MAG: Hsp20/alpha crystallin family protein [SAR202 cluster bacterium]|nr:MAG: Hsp20/alpha crystallin family protein [SAR202 cluster bacterium]
MLKLDMNCIKSYYINILTLIYKGVQMLQLINPMQKNTVDSLFDSAITSFFRPEYRRSLNSYDRALLPIDLSDDGENFVIKADLPGVDPSSVDIQLEKDYLKIEVTNELQNSEKSAHKQLLKERVESSFKRMVKLPESVDSENARSSYTKGVLEVILPKSQKSQVKVIPIT